MFPIKLLETSAHNRDSELLSEYEISDSGYGKDNVKILHIERNGLKHIVREFEISTHLKLYTKKDFTRGDNSDIIATDSQKNTVYLLAKKYGIKCPEEFAIKLAEHFLTKYQHVKAVHIHVSTIPWKRIKYRDDDKSHSHHHHHHHHHHHRHHHPHHHHHRESKHNHAFVHNPIATRFCDVFIKRHDPHPTVISGVKNLRILKTTQSSFENFINDEYRSLPDAADRVFSTNVRSSWQYTNINGINFNDIWHEVITIILKTFAGNYESGKSSPSVQHTIYLAEHEILKCVKEIAVINIEMPNIHYILFDTKKHPKVIDDENKEVFQPVEKPSGIIFAQLRRKDILSKL